MDCYKKINSNLWVSKDKLNNVPIVIKKEYEYLKDLISNRDVCGALFRLKDIYETCAKIPVIMAIIAINEDIEQDSVFIRKTTEQLKKEYQHDSKVIEESNKYKEYIKIQSFLLKNPLSIGTWGVLMKEIYDNAYLFELNEQLVAILSKTLQLLDVKPRKIEKKGNYDNVKTWRNKTIGHGTLLINLDDYWGQVEDLVEGLYDYFSQDLNSLYKTIMIIQKSENDFRLLIGNKEYQKSEYLKGFNGKPYFFDSYYSRQQRIEYTNYLNDSKRQKESLYFQKQFELITSSKNIKQKKKRKISNSNDREMYACLNTVSNYVKPVYAIDSIKKFINKNDKGIFYLQMERGMGKSTLAHGLDGRYQEGFLQKDLNAVVRVYHIRDTLLRGENRKKDFFTALNQNLLTYVGGQLEVDNDEYFLNDQDLRNLIEEKGEQSQLAFIKYLELFREKYEDEIDGLENETKLIYIIDGIDELNSDTKEILDSIPSNKLFNEETNNIYVILLSRKSDEKDLPDIAKKCIQIAEEKTKNVCKIDSHNEQYLQLLKEYIQSNYQNISDEKANKIIEKAQYKFLYIHPYMALGDAILNTGDTIKAYDVAKNYINILQKKYCGISSKLFQLIFASIAVFHSVSLKEMCQAVLFSDVSYDVIGVLNDLLPLLTTKRTDGEDVYEYANEEYEQFIFHEFKDVVCEVICRFRIHVISWFKDSNYRDENYGFQWGNKVQRILYVAEVAKMVGFLEIDDEYIHALINIRKRNPRSFYSRSIDQQLVTHLIDLLLQFDFKETNFLTIYGLESIGLEFKQDNKLNEYTKKMIHHCLKTQKIDIWFQYFMNEKFSMASGIESYQKPYIEAIKEIFKNWKNPNQLVDFFYQKIKDDYDNGWQSQTYAVYLEILKEDINDSSLKEKIYEGLLFDYKMTIAQLKRFPGKRMLEESRRLMISNNLEEAKKLKNLSNYALIEEIENYLNSDSIIEAALTTLEILSKELASCSLHDYSAKYEGIRLNKEKLNPKQFLRYKHIICLVGNAFLEKIQVLADKGNSDDVPQWLLLFSILGGLDIYLENEKKYITCLDLCMQSVEKYVEKKDYRNICELLQPYREFLKYYDENVRSVSCGIYSYECNKKINPKQKLTKWERQFALDCSTFCEVYQKDLPFIPIIANNFIDKLLQELFEEGKLDEYERLNQKMEESYTILHFKEKYILKIDYLNYRVVRHYFRWLIVRYHRSLEGKDHRSSQVIKNHLMTEFNDIYENIMSTLDDCYSLVNTSNIFIHLEKLMIEFLFLAKMLPDECASLKDTKNKLLLKLEEVKKKLNNQEEIENQIERIINRLNDQRQWFNSNEPLIIDLTDRSIFLERRNYFGVSRINEEL